MSNLTPKNPFDAAAHAMRAANVDIVETVRSGHDVTREVSAWDRYNAASEAAEQGAFAAALKSHEKSPTWGAFGRETYSSLYDSGLESPEIPADKRPAGSEWISTLRDQAEALPEWRSLQERARRDPWACGLATGEALSVIAQTAQPPETDPQAIQDEIDLVKDLAGGRASAKQLRHMAGLQRQMKDSLEEHARAKQQLEAKGAAIRSAFRGAAQKAHEQLDEMEGAMAALGAGDGAGQASKVNAPSAEVRKAVLSNAKFRRIMKIAGRMKASAIQKQRDKARPGAEELCDVHPSRDLARMLPSEMSLLGDPTTETLLFRKLLEGSVLTYELRGKEHRTQGPIILLVDESGSMSGEPDEWAKGAAFGFMEIAARQNRPFIYAHFNTAVTRVDEVTEPRSFSLEKILEMCSYFTSGGTRIGVALQYAAATLEAALKTRDKPWGRADVVVITDGVSGDHAEQNGAIDRIKAVGGHLYSLFVGCDGTSDPVGHRADETCSVTRAETRSGSTAPFNTAFSI